MSWGINKRWKYIFISNFTCEFTQFWSHWSRWAFCTSVWGGAYASWSLELTYLVQSFLPTPAPMILIFFPCAGSGPLHILWDCPCSLAWHRGFSVPVQFSLQCTSSSLQTHWLPEYVVTGRDTLIVVIFKNVIIKDNYLICPFLRFFCCKTLIGVPRVRLHSLNSLNTF